LKNEQRIVNALEIRDTDAHNGDPFDFAFDGATGGLVIVENGLDQTVSCLVQGRPSGGALWQTAETSADATASGGQNIDISESWPLIRLVLTCGGLPTSGSVSAWLCRVW